jgi:hypothetical protein
MVGAAVGRPGVGDRPGYAGGDTEGFTGRAGRAGLLGAGRGVPDGPAPFAPGIAAAGGATGGTPGGTEGAGSAQTAGSLPAGAPPTG